MELHHKMYGHGFPTLLLHGVFGMLDNWHHFAKQLSHDFWVITLDQRNHGRSFHSDDFNYEVLAEDIRKFLISHQIKKCNLIGHSMGGKVAMHLALEYHEFVNRLVVIDIGIKQYPRNHDIILQALCNTDLSSFTHRTDLYKELNQSIANEAVVNFLLKNITRDKNSNAFIWKLNLKAIKNNYEKLIEPVESDYQFNGETLFIKGENSNYLSEGDLPEIKNLFPLAELTTIKDAGHWIHAEQEQRLLYKIDEFLKR